jgi:hypothetical protein
VELLTIGWSVTGDRVVGHQHGVWIQRCQNGWREVGCVYIVQDEDIVQGGKSGERRSKGKWTEVLVRGHPSVSLPPLLIEVDKYATTLQCAQTT